MDVGPFCFTAQGLALSSPDNRMFLEQQGDVALRDNVLQEEDTVFTVSSTLNVIKQNPFSSRGLIYNSILYRN